MSPLAKRLGKAGLTNPQRKLNVSMSSPRSRRALGSKGSPQVIQETNDDNTEKELLTNKSFNKVQKTHPPKADLSDHYEMCLKLSSENKITFKNAFELHLIDFMRDMVVKPGGVDFKLAAYTIEAGSKIFSCRVDIVSSKVIKCMNAVTVKGGGTVEEEATEDEGKGPDMKDVQDLETAEATSKKQKDKMKKRKKKKTKMCPSDTKTISIDIGSISCQQLNPLFDKFMHMDVSCSGNLLLSSLLPLNDTQRFIFSSDDPLPTSFHPSDHTPPCLAGCASNKSGETLEGGMVHELGCPVVSSLNRKPVNINKLKGAMLESLKESNVICETFRDFEFKYNFFQTLGDFSKSKYRFDSTSNNCGEDDDDDDDDDDDGAHHAFEFGDIADDCEDALFARDHPDSHADTSMFDKLDFHPTLDKTNLQELNKTISSIKEGDLSSLKAALVRDKDGDLVFNKDFLKMWSGPTLWKQKKFKSQTPSVGTNRNAIGSKTKKSKETSYITFEDEVFEKVDGGEEEVKKKKRKKNNNKPEVGSMEWHFKKINVVRVKIENSLQRLPEPHISSQNSFSSLFIFKDIKLNVLNPSRKKVLEVPGYDYDNLNDKLNYCPPATNTHDYDDDNGYGFEDALDEDADDVNRTANMAKDSAFRIFGTGDAVGEADEDDEEEDGDILTGSRLLPEPEEVVPLRIDYVKRAKNLDVKKMKGKLFEKISSEISRESSKPLELSNLYKDLVKELPSKEAKNFSVALAVSCLLQIANEKNLKLESDSKFEDVVISTEPRNTSIL